MESHILQLFTQTGRSNAETQKAPGLISRGRYSFADPSAVTYHDPDHSLSDERTGRVLIVVHADRLPMKFFVIWC